MTTNYFFFSGSVYPSNYTFGPGLGSGFYIGDTIGNFWSFATSGTATLIIPSAPYSYSVVDYIVASGLQIVASYAGYGLLIFGTESGIPVNYSSGSLVTGVGSPVTYFGEALTTGTGEVVYYDSQGILVTASGNFTEATGIPLSGGPFYSCFSGTNDLFAITISGSIVNQATGVVSGTGIPIGAPFWAGSPQGQTISNFYGVRGVSGFSKIVFNSSGSASGSTTGNVSGMWKSSCISYMPTSSAVLIGGWSPAFFASGASSFAINGGTPATMLTFSPGVSGGSVTAWGQPSGSTPSGLWSFVSALTGVGLGTSLASQFASLSSAVVMDSTSGLFRAFSYLGGTITQTQTAALSGTFPSIATVSGTVALVPQTSTSAVVQYIVSGSSWVHSGAAISGISNPSQIISNGLSAIVGFASGITVAAYNGAWTVLTSVPLSFWPTALSIDLSGNYFCAGGGSAALITSNGTLLASGTVISGSPYILSTATYQANYWVVTSAAIYTLSYQPWQSISSGLALETSAVVNQNEWLLNTGSNWQQRSGAVALSGGLWFVDTLYCPGASGIAEFEVTGPFEIQPRKAGIMALYSGGAYVLVSGFGLGYTPCQAVIDYNGLGRIFTLQGGMINLNQTGGVSSTSVLWSGGGGFAASLSGTNSIWVMPSLAPVMVETF